MLKILQICNKAPFPPEDGSSIAIGNMARGLLSNNVQLQILVINTKKHFKPDNAVDKELRERTSYRSVFRNTSPSAPGALINLFSSRSYFISRFYFRKFAVALEQTLKATEFDIVQIEGLFMATYIPLIRQHSRALIALRTHNVEHLIWNRYFPQVKSALKRKYFGLQNRRLKRFEEKTINEVDALVPISTPDALEFKKLGCTKPVYTCPSGLDLSYYQSGPTPVNHTATVFCFGSMDWIPNQEAAMWFLDNCWAAVLAAVPEARLIIAGKNMPLPFFRINRPNVLVQDKVDDSRSFYLKHAVMIVPLLSGSGLRIKILEGMAYGKAIVSTSIGAEGIPYTNGEDILIADEPGEFSAHVIRLLKDEKKREQIGKNAADLAKSTFDNNALTAGLAEFYKKLING